ncbi:MAG TPA: hypothetical protein VFG03_08340 [Telluria sp.]|nr:hypothetical protein [Telluria sp.]
MRSAIAAGASVAVWMKAACTPDAITAPISNAGSAFSNPKSRSAPSTIACPTAYAHTNIEQACRIGGRFLARIDQVDNFLLLRWRELWAATANAAFSAGGQQAAIIENL